MSRNQDKKFAAYERAFAHPRNGKIPIGYRSYISDSNGKPFRVYMFYPDRQWDNYKRGLEEAQKSYPKTKYDWIEIPD